MVLPRACLIRLPLGAGRTKAGQIFHLTMDLLPMPTETPQPAIVLVRPQMGENIGAAARAMWNFGLDRMRIVSPRDGWPNQRAVAMSSGAGRLLDKPPCMTAWPMRWAIAPLCWPPRRGPGG